MSVVDDEATKTLFRRKKKKVEEERESVPALRRVPLASMSDRGVKVPSRRRGVAAVLLLLLLQSW